MTSIQHGPGRLGRRAFVASAMGLAATPVLTTGSAAAALTATDPSPSDPAIPAPRRPVTPGVDALAARDWDVLAGRRVGVVTNPTGVLLDLRHEVDAMADHDAVDIVAVFGPEHGFRGTAQAGGSEETYVDERTGITVYDAYGATATKLARFYRESGVDTVVFDIQDVGARFYTYIWTMYEAMRAAVAEGVSFVVLDRPNPIGGAAFGPMMTPEYTSGVGKKEIVQQHGMTVGELARFFDGEFLQADAGGRLSELTVVRVDGWRRDVTYSGTGLPWVLPSPNMPTPDTALVYPGTCLFEGTTCSEGRGTTRPFELIGAPWADYRWADAVRSYDLPGVQIREAYFAPTFSKHQGKTCAGIQVHVSDARSVDPIRTAVAMLVEAHRLYDDFAWRRDSWDPARPYWIDKLSGSPRLREMVDAGAPLDEVVGAWAAELAEFRARRQPYLLYNGPAA